MGTEQQRVELLTTVRQQLRKLAETEPDTLARTKELSHDINFAEAVSCFRDMIEIIRELHQRELDRLPEDVLASIQKACKILEDRINEVKKFDLNTNAPRDVCNAIVDRVKKSYDSVVSPLLLPLAFTATQATDFDRLEREAKGCLAEMERISEDTKQKLDGIQGEASEALGAIQEQAAQGGVSKNAEFFKLDCEQHLANARTWKGWTIATAVITTVVTFAFFAASWFYTPQSTPAAIQYVASKVILISALFFVTVWCARNYKAQMHNHTLNKHRQNALQTFKTFIEGTSDERVKDAILLHTANAAFSPRSTGYDHPEPDGHHQNPILEVVRQSIPQLDQASG
jgi:hypothetical protein